MRRTNSTVCSKAFSEAFTAARGRLAKGLLLRGITAVAAGVLLAGALAGSGADVFAGDRTGVVEDAPKEEKKKSVDANDVFYGDAREWTKPAEVDADAIYAEIEEYQQIRDEKLTATDARYGVLLTKATKRFRCAVRKAAKAGEYDLVAKVGAVKGVDSVPSITSAVIGKL